MKLLDIIKEEATPITEKERIRARKVYKALKTGIYRPYVDINRLKYILPDFEDHQIYKLSNEGMVMMFTDFNKIKMFIVTDEDVEIPVRIQPTEDRHTGVSGSITKKIKSKFLKYGIVMNIGDL